MMTKLVYSFEFETLEWGSRDNLMQPREFWGVRQFEIEFWSIQENQVNKTYKERETLRKILKRVFQMLTCWRME